MKIAVDAMGGDFAPAEVVKGAVKAAREYGVGIMLVGPETVINKELAGHDTAGADINIVHTDEYLVEGEHPAFALRQKRKASVLVAVKLVKEGKAEACFSAGPTGGVVAASLGVLGTLEGIARPVVGGTFLGFAPNTIVMDLGSNVDCRPDQLLDFGVVGTVYARKLLNITNPTVALLSVGVEEGKGNEAVRESYPLFKKSGLNFIGNIEGNDIAYGKANVVICDGFTGNAVVKFCEGLGKTTAKWLEEKLRGKLSQGDVKEIVDGLLLATNPADTVGGGPLWAVDGLVYKAHGRSKAPEIATTLGHAKRAAEVGLVATLKAELTAARNKLDLPTV